MSKPEIIALSAAEKADMSRYLPETFGAKLRRLARQSYSDNPDTRLPWTEVAAWTASTVYSYGQVVKNGGQRYVCLTPGTSAASGGPSAVNTGSPAADGTCAWSWVGPVELATNDAYAPVVTSSTASPSTGGMSNIWYPALYPDVFDLRGGLPTVATSNRWNVNVGQSKADGTLLGGQGASIVFETDELKIAIGCSTGSNSQIGFIIDGRWYSVSQTPNVGTTTWYTFDFTANGPRRTRRIEIVSYRINFQFVGVATRPNGTIWKPALADKVTAVFIGDSLFQGSGQGPAVAGNTVPHRVGRKLGWSHVWNFGIGGTAYLNKGSTADLYTFAERLPQVFAQSPDVLVVGTIVNDLIGNRTKAQMKAAVVAFIADVRTYDQHIPIILLGCWSHNATGFTSTVADAEAAVREAVQEAGDGRLFFIPIFNQGGLPLVHGSWNNSFKSDADNSSIMLGADQLHPPDVGSMVYADHTARSIVRDVLPAL